MLNKRHTMVEEDRKEPLNKYNLIDDQVVGPNANKKPQENPFAKQSTI